MCSTFFLFYTCDFANDDVFVLKCQRDGSAVDRQMGYVMQTLSVDTQPNYFGIFLFVLTEGALHSMTDDRIRFEISLDVYVCTKTNIVSASNG